VTAINLETKTKQDSLSPVSPSFNPFIVNEHFSTSFKSP